MTRARPRANLSQCVVSHVDGECVVYDPTRGVAHALDGPAYRLLQDCNATSELDEVLKRAGERESLPLGELRDRFEQLEAAALIDWTAGERRAFLRRLVVVGTGVVTFAIPGPAAAASCAGLMESCVGVSCCSGLQCVGGTCMPG